MEEKMINEFIDLCLGLDYTKGDFDKKLNKLSSKNLLNKKVYVEYLDMEVDSVVACCFSNNHRSDIYEMFESLLLNENIDIETKDKRGCTPLFLLSIADDAYLPLILMLIENGANVNTKNSDGSSIIHEIIYLSKHRNIGYEYMDFKCEIIEAILDAGFDTSAKRDKDNLSAFEFFLEVCKKSVYERYLAYSCFIKLIPRDIPLFKLNKLLGPLKSSKVNLRFKSEEEFIEFNGIVKELDDEYKIYTLKDTLIKYINNHPSDLSKRLESYASLLFKTNTWGNTHFLDKFHRREKKIEKERNKKDSFYLFLLFIFCFLFVEPKQPSALLVSDKD